MSPKAGSSNLNEPEFGVKGKLTIKREPFDRKPVEPRKPRVGHGVAILRDSFS